MNTTIQNDAFIATLTTATFAAAKAYPMLTPIYINTADASDWTDSGDFEDYLPIDPAGKFFYNFAASRGTKVTKKCAKSFVRQYGEALYNLFVEFADAEPARTDAMEVALAALFNKDIKNAAKPVNVALAEADADVDAPADDNADGEPVVTAEEGNAEEEAEPAQEEAAEEAVEAEQEDSVEEAAEQEEEALEEEQTAPVVEQARRRGPQAAKRVKMEAGAVNLRTYKGQTYEVRILEDGKRCTVDGQEYSSLSTAALQMFDLHVSGVRFWQFVR